jgi:Flp pilus assembly protein TadG
MARNKSMARYKLCGFLRDTDGAIAAWFALSLLIFIGMAALAIDISYAISTRNNLQVAASAAALAGAGQLQDQALIEPTAIAYAEKNMDVARHGNVLVDSDVDTGTWDPATRTFSPLVGSDLPNAVRVTTRRAAANDNPLELFFGGAIGTGQIDISTTAVAVGQAAPPTDACLIALDPSAPRSLWLTGNSTIDGNGCGVHVNSCDAAGLRANGRPAIVDAPLIDVCGPSYSAPGTPTFLPSEPIARNECTPTCQIENPVGFNVLDEQDVFGNTVSDWLSAPCGPNIPNISGNKDYTVPPGVHCGGFKKTGKGSLTFAPGVHVIRNGALDIKANNQISGTGVTIILQNATIDWAGGNDYCLRGSAFPDVPLLIYQDPFDAAGNKTHKIAGNSGAGLGGILDFGWQDIDIKGTAQVGGGCPQTTCTAFIARRINTVGTTDLVLNSECGGALAEIELGYPLRLVK